MAKNKNSKKQKKSIQSNKMGTEFSSELASAESNESSRPAKTSKKSMKK